MTKAEKGINRQREVNVLEGIHYLHRKTQNFTIFSGRARKTLFAKAVRIALVRGTHPCHQKAQRWLSPVGKE